MNKTPVIAIIGGGSIGSLVGCKLHTSGYDPFILDRNPERANKISHKLEFEGIDNSEKVVVPIRVTADKQMLSNADIAIICVKSYDLPAVIDVLDEYLPKKSIILTLQNGLLARSSLMSNFAVERVYSATATIGANKINDFLVKETGKGIITLENKEHSPDIADIFLQSGFSVTISDNIDVAIWEKAALNCAINPLGAILKLKNGELIKNPELVELMIAIAEEVVMVAIKSGIPMPKRNYEQYIIDICTKTAGNYNSMCQDILNDKRTEIDALNGAVVNIAKITQTNAVLNKTIATLIRNL